MRTKVKVREAAAVAADGRYKAVVSFGMGPVVRVIPFLRRGRAVGGVVQRSLAPRTASGVTKTREMERKKLMLGP